MTLIISSHFSPLKALAAHIFGNASAYLCHMSAEQDRMLREKHKPQNDSTSLQSSQAELLIHKVLRLNNFPLFPAELETLRVSL